MAKTVKADRVLHSLLRTVREAAGLTQNGLAKKLGKPQSFVSKYESGERRLDILELHAVCEACDISLAEFAKQLEAALDD
ncbi:MAG: helix-turn-helix domain-containing protein [Gemmatimonadota bacterium]